MYGDFSRDSFSPAKNYTRVLLQQGRPLTDADWNEMVECLLREQRELATTVTGWHGSSDDGFELRGAGRTFKVLAGTYYVDGILCCNDCNVEVSLPAILDDNAKRDIYLDVWEESVTSVDDVCISEPSLVDIESSVRSRTVWALRINKTASTIDPSTDRLSLLKVITGIDSIPSSAPPKIAVRFQPAKRNATGNDSACEIREVATLGRELLYRIEVHGQGTVEPPAPTAAVAPVGTVPPAGAVAPAGAAPGAGAVPAATFKWSRENGDTVVPVKEFDAPAQQLFFEGDGALVQQRRRRLRPGAWVELLDDRGNSRGLVKLKEVQATSVSITPAPDVDRLILAQSPKVRACANIIRQWDHNENSNEPFVKTKDSTVWVDIENGLSVRFQGGFYQPGDYWLIRVTADGNVRVSNPSPTPAVDGEQLWSARRSHHFAPLGTITKNGNDYTVTTPWRQALDFPGNPDPDRKKRVDCPVPTPVAAPAPAPAPAPVGPGGGNNGIGPPPPHAPQICELTDVGLASPASLLSGEGARALKGYLATSNLTRLIPARYLNYKPKSAIYARFRSALLVSEILEDSFNAYIAKVERCISFSAEERPVVEEDARADFDLAVEFQKQITAQRLSSRMA